MVIDKLRKRIEFKRLTTNGQVIRSKSFILQYAKAAHIPENAIPFIRFGLTITKKIGNSVKRNRIKRRLRALIYEVFPESALPFHDYVFIGRDSAFHMDFLLLKDEMIKALEKIKETK